MRSKKFIDKGKRLFIFHVQWNRYVTVTPIRFKLHWYVPYSFSQFFWGTISVSSETGSCVLFTIKDFRPAITFPIKINSGILVEKENWQFKWQIWKYRIESTEKLQTSFVRFLFLEKKLKEILRCCENWTESPYWLTWRRWPWPFPWWPGETSPDPRCALRWVADISLSVVSESTWNKQNKYVKCFSSKTYRRPSDFLPYFIPLHP